MVQRKGDPGGLFDVDGKVVVITGGLGMLGRQFASTLLDLNASVAVLDVPSAVTRAREVFGGLAGTQRLLCLETDVTDRDSLMLSLARVQEVLGEPQGLVTCAAIDSPPQASSNDNPPFEQYPLATWQRVLDVNVTGVFLTCQVIGGQMARNGQGSIVNISSIYGLLSPDQRIYAYRARAGDPFVKPVSYSVSKAAVLNLTRYLATYWADQGVRVNTLTFGGVASGQDEEFVAAYTARVPLGRMARVDEYNGAVVFLLSDASSYMTGANVVLDGGWTAW